MDTNGDYITYFMLGIVVYFRPLFWYPPVILRKPQNI